MSTHDSSTAYYRPEPSTNTRFTDVGKGTPMGELLRRYWHPVALTSDAGGTPKKIRVLGEDLILFRDGRGRPGLLHPNCAHRGTTLFYGRVEDQGIRCCYHGWLFDVQGRCVEQPCEPAGGQHRAKVRQPWYPVTEQYGLIFAYLGPTDRQPVLPRYEALDNLAEGEFIEADDRSIGGGGPTVIPCNWFQHYENIVDPFHVVVLHGSFSGTQFVELMGQMPDVEFGHTPMGVKVVSHRTLDDGAKFLRITETAIPTLRVVPSPRVGRFDRVESIGWVLPIDDTSFRIYTAARVRQSGELQAIRSRMNGKLWEDLTESEHQRFPGDFEAQVGQGAKPWHSEEHLASSDRGVVMLRRFFEEQLRIVEQGGDPAGTHFDPATPPIVFEAGNFRQSVD